jgi:hypothetical protein
MPASRLRQTPKLTPEADLERIAAVHIARQVRVMFERSTTSPPDGIPSAHTNIDRAKNNIWRNVSLLPLSETADSKMDNAGATKLSSNL